MPTVETNGVETYYERRGDGPPVVFVHGGMLDHRQWEPQVAALAGDYETYAYDVRGHGRTGGSALTSYSIELFARDLASLVDALGLDRFALCGTSTGGCVAQVYAARHPERVAALVLADTFTPALSGRAEYLQRSLSLRLAVHPVRLVGYERVERWLVGLYERLHDERASGDYGAVRALRSGGPGMRTGEFAKVARAIAGFHETTVDLAAVAAPTLVLYGEHEPPFLRAHATRFADAIPDVAVREVPDAGHAANLDNPTAFTAALEEFLADTYAAAE